MSVKTGDRIEVVGQRYIVREVDRKLGVVWATDKWNGRHAISIYEISDILGKDAHIINALRAVA